MSNFDPSKLSARPSNSSAPSGRSERIFMVVDTYETPDGGFHFAVGHRPDRPEEKIRVRLNTVAERIQDRPKLSPESVKSQYVSGENTRDTIADKAKANIKLVAFDDCRRLSQTEGVTEFRAHWPKTIATQPEAELMTGKAHIRLKPASDHANGHSKAQAYVELIKGAAQPTAENIDRLLTDALAIKDADGRARDPLMIMRVKHQGKIVGTPRLYPSMNTAKTFDQALGEEREITRPVDADVTVARLMGGEPGYNDRQNAMLDAVRALVAGIKGDGEPTFNSTDLAIHTKARNLYWGAKEGHLEVEIVSAEKIDFGADSRKTYLKDKDLPQLAAYVVKEPKEDQSFRETSGYTDTVIGVLRHEDGEPYAVYASPAQMYPKAYKLAELRLAVEAPDVNAETKADANIATQSVDRQESDLPVVASESSESIEQRDENETAPSM